MKEIAFKNNWELEEPPLHAEQDLSEEFLDSIRAMERVFGANFIIERPHKRTLVYVSNNIYLLGGKTSEEIRQSGYAGFLELLGTCDKELLQVFSVKGLEYIYTRVPVDERLHLTASVDVKLQGVNGAFNMVHMVLTPLELAKDGRIEMALMRFHPSSSAASGNIQIMNELTGKGVVFDNSSKQWVPFARIELTAREKQILYLAARGLNLKQLGENMHITSHTVKFHRQKIFEKLEVNTIVEAVAKATQQGLI